MNDNYCVISFDAILVPFCCRMNIGLVFYLMKIAQTETYTVPGRNISYIVNVEEDGARRYTKRYKPPVCPTGMGKLDD